jgi:tetratricopeptide (TPR) repeat protein
MRSHSALGFEYFMLTKSVQELTEKQKYYEQAKTEFERSIQIYPENNYALYNYGVMEYYFGKLIEALALYRKAVRVDSNDYNSWNDLSVISFQLEQYDSSMRYFNKLLRFRPEDTKVIEAIGVIHARKKEYDQAIECYKKALVIEPARELTYNNLIQVLSIKGDTAGVRFYNEQKRRNVH